MRLMRDKKANIPSTSLETWIRIFFSLFAHTHANTHKYAHNNTRFTNLRSILLCAFFVLCFDFFIQRL